MVISIQALTNLTCEGYARNKNDLLSNDCYGNTLMVWIPCGWLWLSLIGYIPYLRCQKTYPNRVSLAYAIKMTLTTLLVIIYIGKLAEQVTREKFLQYLPNIIMLLTLVLSMILQFVERQRRLITSGVNFIFSFLAFFTMGIFFFHRKTNIQRYTFDVLDLILKFFLVVAFSFADCNPSNDLTPVEKASFLSRITYFWMTRIMFKGFKQRLSENDIPDLLASEQAEHLHQKFKITQEKLSHKNGNSISLIKVLIHMFWKKMMITFILRLFYDILIFLNPVLLSFFMAYLGNKSTHNDPAVGYVYSLLFFTINVLLVLLDQAVFSAGWKTGINVSTTLMTVIYDKVQKIGIRTPENVAIINILSTDVNMFQEMIPFMFVLWSGPFQTLICFVILFHYIRETAFFSFLTIPMIFIFFIISKKIERMQNKYIETKGNRLQLLEEMIVYIKSVKLFAQEEVYLEELKKIRNQEIKYLKKRAYFESSISTLGMITPQLITLFIFITLQINSITTKYIFITLMALNILETNMSQYSDCIFDVIKAKESYKNIVEFLNLEECSFKLDEAIPGEIRRDSLDFLGTNSSKKSDLVNSVVITDATFEDQCLKNINLKIKAGQLVAVCGKQNSGKSALLFALLGQMKKESGTVCREGKVAYTPQEPWVINDTIKMNILFGKKYHKRHFQQALKYCCIDENDMMVETIIKAKGSNLSGGQLYRINLARAVYSRPDIFLLDNPLCSVDAPTAMNIYNNLLGENGLIKNITRIIVTQPTAKWLPKADQIIVMSSNTIAESGTYSELRSKEGEFAQLLQQCPQEEVLSQSENVKEKSIMINSLEDSLSILQTRNHVGTKFWKSVSIKFRNKSTPSRAHFVTSERFNRQISRRLYMNKKSLQMTQLKVDDLSTKDTKFKVARGVFCKYLRTFGIMSLLSTILLAVLFEGFRTASNFMFDSSKTIDLKEKNYRLLYSGSFSLVAGISLFLFGVLSTLFAAKACCKIHHSMAENVFNMPLRFFESTDQGLIMMLFTEILFDVDYELPNSSKMWIEDFLKILVATVLFGWHLPVLVFIIVGLLILLFISWIFVRTTSLLQNFSFKFQALLYTHFLETESGSHIIKAFSNEKIFTKKAYECIDKNQKFSWSVIAAKRWAGFLLQFIGCAIILITCLYFAIKGIDSRVGLILTYILQTVKCFDWVVRSASDIAVKRVSLHKIQEYINKVPKITGNTPTEWPSEGKIEFLKYSAAYLDRGMNCLNDINLCIKPKEKVGIVGKSGSGKSSLLMALTHLITRKNGNINIDGTDIKLINPKYLRSKLTIFPQNTNLFTGNLRSNLDPEGKFSDEELTRVLTEVYLGDRNLDHPCEKFCTGDKQLVGLAKCILKKTKILILDECTANVCATLDEQIQRIIDEKFSDCTVLNIVHNLNMVEKYDKILVMDNGEAKEFDTPSNLTSRKHSFYMKLKEQKLKTN